MTKIFFDHTYTIDDNFLLFKRMNELGFNISDKISAHPSLKSRFIYFKNGKYIEFVNYSEPIKKWWYLSGLSFGVDSSLKKFSQLSRFKHLGPAYSHRNYNWKDNNNDYLPGWNFLSFKKLGIRTFYPWFTEYEKGRRKIPKRVNHHNGINEFHGNLFRVNPKGLEFFELLFKRKIKDKVELTDGTWLYFKPGKTNRHEAIILRANSMSRAQGILKESKLVRTHDVDLYLVDYPNRYKNCWKVGIISP